MEKAIVSNLIRKILRYGYAVNIDNGGDSIGGGINLKFF